jgi:hypothetical protein
LVNPRSGPQTHYGSHGFERHPAVFIYRRRYDSGGFVPYREWFPPCLGSQFIPYIFSDLQVRTILREIARGQGSRVELLGQRLLWQLLYCIGLRFGEAARLQVGDLDFRRRLLWILESKGRTRLIPFGSDLAGSSAVTWLSWRKTTLIWPPHSFFSEGASSAVCVCSFDL